jgi:hypothetical protein
MRDAFFLGSESSLAGAESVPRFSSKIDILADPGTADF